jgi:hypothetical protein
MSRTRTLLPLALLTLLLLAPAASAGEWVAPVSFAVPSADSFEGTPGEDQIRYQNGGTATEAFIQIDSLTPVASTTLHVGTLPPGGAYSDQLTIGSSEGYIPVNVAIAVAPDGAAIAAWSELTATNVATSPYRFRAAYRPAGSGSWEAPVMIATETQRESAIVPKVVPAISAKGTAAVGVEYNADEIAQEHEPTARIDVAVRSTAGSWSTKRISPPGESAESLSLGFDLAGDLTAAYLLRFNEGSSSSTSDDRETVIVQRHPAPSGIWGPLEDISGEEPQWTADALYLGENEAGEAVVAYQRVGEGPTSLETWAATSESPNTSWTKAASVVSSGSSAPDAAGVAPNGTAYVLYSFQGTSSAEDCAGVVRAPVGHSFTPEQCVSLANEDSFSASVAFLGNDAYFAWTGSEPGPGHPTSIQGTRWTNGANAPEVGRNLDTPGTYGAPELLEDRQGSVVALYRDEADKSLRAAAYDGGPPILLGASVPTSAVSGQAVTFSASLVDLWAGLGAGQPTWSFSDGTISAGATVTHTFAAPGIYGINLNAADALGNTTTGTYTIVVTPAAQSPPRPADRQPPKVTLNTPSCPKKLSKKACKRRRASIGAWRTLGGSVTDPAPSSGIASVQVAVYLTRGKRIMGLSHGRFLKTTKAKARKAFVTAEVSGDSWSLKLPKLGPGSYTFLVRASDQAGNVSALVSRTVRLS